MKALFIGRFQPFHNGHLRVLQQLSSRYDDIIIGIGSSQYHDTSDNPFSGMERKKMIAQSLHAAGIQNVQIVLIPDIHDPPRWVDHVCSLVLPFDVVIANNPITKKLFVEKGYVVKGTQYFDRKNNSGKEIRRRIRYNEQWYGLVPESVCTIIHDIHGVERIRKTTSTTP